MDDQPNILLPDGKGSFHRVSKHEVSTKPSFIKHDNPKFVKKILKLYGLEVKIGYGQYGEKDLVADMYKAHSEGVILAEVAPPLNRVAQYLLKTTVDYLDCSNTPDIYQKTFPLGFIDPSELSPAENLDDFFRILMYDYQSYRRAMQESLIGLQLGSGITTESNMMELSRLEGGTLRDEIKPDLQYHLLKTLADDCTGLGELISLGTVELFQPYLLALNNQEIRSQDRQRMTGMILHLDYPFMPGNRYDDHHEDLWLSEIRDAADNR